MLNDFSWSLSKEVANSDMRVWVSLPFVKAPSFDSSEDSLTSWEMVLAASVVSLFFLSLSNSKRGSPFL